MTQLKLRENGEEKGTYTEESIAFGNALWDFLTKTKKKEPPKKEAERFCTFMSDEELEHSKSDESAK